MFCLHSAAILTFSDDRTEFIVGDTVHFETQEQIKTYIEEDYVLADEVSATGKIKFYTLEFFVTQHPVS